MCAHCFGGARVASSGPTPRDTSASAEPCPLTRSIRARTPAASGLDAYPRGMFRPGETGVKDAALFPGRGRGNAADIGSQIAAELLSAPRIGRIRRRKRPMFARTRSRLGNPPTHAQCSTASIPTSFREDDLSIDIFVSLRTATAEGIGKRIARHALQPER